MIVLMLMAKFNQHSPLKTALDLAELKTSDLRMYAHPGRKPLGVVAIAAIDDPSIAELGRWPWPRSVMADLVNALVAYKVAAVGFDVVFSEADSADAERAAMEQKLAAAGLATSVIDTTLGPGNDAAFAAAMQAQGTTILAYPFKSHEFRSVTRTSEKGYVTHLVPPPPFNYGLVMTAPDADPPILGADAYLPPINILRYAARGNAYVDVDADLDGTFRTEMTVVKFHNRYCAPLFLALTSVFANNAQLSLGIAKDGIGSVTIGDESIPIQPNGKVLIDFRGPAGTFPNYPVTDIIHHRIPPAALAGKIVLVGVTGHGLGDRIVTPVGADYPGVEMHANAIDDVLQDTFVIRSDNSLDEEMLAALVIGLGVSLAAGSLTALSSALTALALCAGYFIYAQYRLNNDGVLVGVIFPLLTAIIIYILLASYRYVTEGMEKRRLRHAFEHYLHPDVIASVVDNPEGLRLGGERRHLSILFSDIVNFTARAERSNPEELVALLNTYMTAMTDLVLKGDGVVDKLMGDGLMAFWGAPNEVENPARAAIDCALKMLTELKALRQRDSRFSDLDIGIGIATGEVIVGNFGGEDHFSYSVIGDTVNLASRLEGLTRRFGVHLIVTQSTLKEARSDYLAREIGLVRVKGKQEEVPVAEVIGLRDGNARDNGHCAGFAEVVGMIRSGAADGAAERLRALQIDQPDDRLIAMYLEKIAHREIRESGDVVFEFETK